MRQSPPFKESAVYSGSAELSLFSKGSFFGADFCPVQFVYKTSFKGFLMLRFFERINLRFFHRINNCISKCVQLYILIFTHR